MLSTALLLTLTLAQPVSLPGQEPAPPPATRVLDQNGDGEVSRSEFHAETNRTFRRLDRDGDGFLSRAEMEVGHMPWTRVDVQPPRTERFVAQRLRPAERVTVTTGRN